jgi:hypothetical protein
MFFEEVPITSVIGTTPTQIFSQYGIDQSRIAQVLALPQNDELRRRIGRPLGPGTDLTGGDSIYIPIDHDVTVTRSIPRVDMVDGLRPLQRINGVLDRTHVSDITHGVEILLDRTGPACNRMRWLQTIKTRNDPNPTRPSEFVDIGSNGLPWYNDVSRPDPVQFDDVPCGPQAPATGTGYEFFATVSLAVWTMERITIAKSFTYGFTIGRGTTIAAVRWNPQIRVATPAEVQEQIRILRAGINQFRQQTGGALIYNPIPSDNSINGGILFGRF